MKAFLYAQSALLTAVLLFFAGLTIVAPNVDAVPTAPQNASKYQSWLTEQVRHKLVTLPWYGVFDNLEYRINDSEVTLSGQVINDVTKYNAESAVKNIEGVTRVVNNIQVLPLSPFDDTIRRAEYRAIYSQSQLSRYSLAPVPQIHIIVNNGHVTLEGVVANEADRNVAEITAKTVSGVFSVTNHLRIG